MLLFGLLSTTRDPVPPFAPSLLFIQATNETYSLPLLSHVDAPSFALIEGPAQYCTFTAQLQPQPPLPAPFIFGESRNYLDLPNLWVFGVCHSAVIGTSPASTDSQNCPPSALSLDSGGSVQFVTNVYSMHSVFPGSSGSQTLSGNGVSLTGFTYQGNRTALVYTLLQGPVLNLSYYALNNSIVQSFTLSLSNSTAAAMLTNCPNFYFADLVSAFMLYCNRIIDGQTDIFLIDPSSFSLDSTGTRVYASTSYAFNKVDSVKVNPLLYQFGKSLNWTITFITASSPELCRLEGTALSCLALHISLTPILGVQQFFDDAGVGTLLYYNQKEIYEFKLPQYIHRYQLDLGPVIYASLDQLYLYVKVQQSQGPVFVVLPRSHQTQALAALSSLDSTNIFLLPFYSLLQPQFFLSTSSAFQPYFVRPPALLITVNDPSAPDFNLTIRAFNSDSYQLLHFQVVLTTLLRPSFVVLFKSLNLTTLYNLVYLPLASVARAVGPLLSVLPFHFDESFDGELFTINRGLFNLRSQQDILLLLLAAPNQLVVAFGNSSRMFAQTFTLDYKLQVAQSSLQDLSPSPCYSQRSIQLRQVATFHVIFNPSTICLCEDRLKCLILAQTTGSFLQAQVSLDRVLAIEAQGTNAFLLIISYNEKLNFTLGSFQASTTFVVRFEEQAVLALSGRKLQVFWVNIYLAHAGRLYPTDQLQLGKGCFPIYLLNIVIACPGDSKLLEYRLLNFKLVFVRVLPLYGYTVISSAGSYRSTAVIHVLFPDGITKGLLAVDTSYETVSAMRLAVVGDPPYSVAGFADLLSLVYRVEGVDRVALYQGGASVVGYQFQTNTSLQCRLRVQLGYSSELYYNDFNFFTAFFNLSSSFILPLPNFSLPFQHVSDAFPLQQFYEALVRFDIQNVLGPVAEYRVAQVQKEPDTLTQLILLGLYVPVKEVGQLVDLTIYGEIYSLLLVQFSNPCFLNGYLLGATPFYLVLFSQESAQYFSWKSLNIMGSPEQCSFGPFNATQDSAYFLMFCQLFVQFSTVPFKSSFLIRVTQLPSQQPQLSLSNFSFPQIVHQFQSVVSAGQTLVVLSTPVIRRGDERNMFVCQTDPTLSFKENCVGLDSANGSLVEIDFDSSSEGGVTIAVVNSITLDLFVFGDVVFTQKRTLVVSNLSVPVTDILRKADLQPSESAHFVRVASRNSTLLLLVLTTDSAYLQLGVSLPGLELSLMRTFSKYFYCISKGNVQFSGELMLAPCSSLYPSSETYVQVFNYSWASTNPFPRQVVETASQTFASFAQSLRLVVLAPQPVFGLLRSEVEVKARTTDRKLKFLLTYRNVYYSTDTLVSLYWHLENSLFLAINGAFALAGLLAPLLCRLILAQPSARAIRVDIEMQLLEKQPDPQ